LRFCLTNLARSACWSRDDSGTVMSYAWYFHVSRKSSILWRNDVISSGRQKCPKFR